MPQKTFTKKWLLSLAASPPDGRTEYADADYKYLRVRVTPAGAVTLSVYKAPRGKRTAVRRGLPLRVDEHLPGMPELRSIAAKIAAEIDAGSAKGSAITLDEGLKQMLKDSRLKPRTVAGYRRNVEKHLAGWKGRPLTGDPAAILKMHRAVAKAAGAVAANNALRTYRRILKHAGASGYEAPAWPVDQLRVLRLWSPEVPRDRRLERDTFPLVWAAIENLEPLWRDLMRFYLLTGCRRREATGLRSADVDFQLGTITFRDTKNHRDHVLPVTATLRGILADRARAAGRGLLFPVSEPKNITRRLEKATGVHITPHDCRRTFASVAELAGVGSHTTSVLLNHKSGSITGTYMGRLDTTALRAALERIEANMRELAKPAEK